ncbi:hypothetical protein ABIB57_002874 [Devosia sp. UYZn731]|uniref:hypothetical protein n=1 Tax=Devosia sp. UYZn731 TaxID=3156345 RepID=UPI003391ADDB
MTLSKAPQIAPCPLCLGKFRDDNDLLGFATLIRTVNHEDAASIADALTRCILDLEAPPAEEMLGLKRPGMTWKRSDVRRLIVAMADHFNGQLANIGGSPLSKTSVASYIIKEAKRCEPAYKA